MRNTLPQHCQLNNLLYYKINMTVKVILIFYRFVNCLFQYESKIPIKISYSCLITPIIFLWELLIIFTNVNYLINKPMYKRHCSYPSYMYANFYIGLGFNGLYKCQFCGLIYTTYLLCVTEVIFGTLWILHLLIRLANWVIPRMMILLPGIKVALSLEESLALLSSTDRDLPCHTVYY